MIFFLSIPPKERGKKEIIPRHFYVEFHVEDWWYSCELQCFREHRPLQCACALFHFLDLHALAGVTAELIVAIPVAALDGFVLRVQVHAVIQLRRRSVPRRRLHFVASPSRVVHAVQRGQRFVRHGLEFLLDDVNDLTGKFVALQVHEGQRRECQRGQIQLVALAVQPVAAKGAAYGIAGAC